MIYLKIKLRRFIARYLTSFVRLYIKLKLKLINFEKTPPIIILTIGKVGSSSVYYSLKKQLKQPVFHLHYFTDESISKYKKQHLGSKRKSLPLHLIVSEELLKIIEKKNIKLKIITLTREPIGQRVSAFFQNTEMYGKVVEGNNININEKKSLEILEILFNNEDIYNEEQVWFNNEIKNHFNIDVFDSDFLIKKGFKIYSKERTDVLLIRMEDLDRVFNQATKELFNNTDGYNLYSANVAENKIYKNAYTNVKKSFSLSKEQISKFIISKFVQKFYTDKQEIIKNKWMLK